MHVAITGGAGFIGSAVARALARAGTRLTILDADLARRFGDRPLPVIAGHRVCRVDIRDAAALERALADVDVVCHQAAMVGLGVDLQDLPSYASNNDLGTAQVLATMARCGVPRIVLAGSMVVYGEGRYRCPTHGDQAAPPRRTQDLDRGRFEPRCGVCGADLCPQLVPEDAVPDPRNAYAVSKLAQELYVRVWARETGGSAVILRYHNVYGPGMPRDTPYAGVAAIFRAALERGGSPAVFEDGGQRRDFVHVEDVARANVLAIEALLGAGLDDPVTILNVGSGEQRTVLELASALARVVPGPAPVVTGAYRLGDVRHVTADTRRIRRILRWCPQVEFERGLASLVNDTSVTGRPA